jgi:hypothetical protein
VRGAVIAAAALALGLALTGCGPRAPGVETIDRIEFNHGPKVAPLDADLYVQEDPREVAAFVGLLQKYDIDPAEYAAQKMPRCPDDETTRVDVYYGDSGLGAGFAVPACAAQDGTFEAEATALLNTWFDEVSPGTGP